MHTTIAVFPEEKDKAHCPGTVLVWYPKGAYSPHDCFTDEIVEGVPSILLIATRVQATACSDHSDLIVHFDLRAALWG